MKQWLRPRDGRDLNQLNFGECKGLAVRRSERGVHHAH